MGREDWSARRGAGGRWLGGEAGVERRGGSFYHALLLQQEEGAFKEVLLSGCDGVTLGADIVVKANLACCPACQVDNSIIGGGAASLNMDQLAAIKIEMKHPDTRCVAQRETACGVGSAYPGDCQCKVSEWFVLGITHRISSLVEGLRFPVMSVQRLRFLEAAEMVRKPLAARQTALRLLPVLEWVLALLAGPQRSRQRYYWEFLC